MPEKKGGIVPGALERNEVKFLDGPKRVTDAEMAVAKANPLPPADYYRARKRINLTLDAQAVHIAKKLGDSNVSRGVDRALFYYRDSQQEKRHAKKKARRIR